MVFKVLLALLFSFGAVIAIGLAIYFAMNGTNEDDVEQAKRNVETAKARKYSAADIAEYEENAADIEKQYSKSTLRFSIAVIVAIICVVAFIIVPWNFYTVNAGEAVVIKHLGEAKEVKTSGTYANFWMTNSKEKYDLKVRTLDIETMTYSNDAQTMDITMTVQYHINQEDLIKIINQYGDVTALENKLQSVSIEKTKSVLSSYKAMDIIANRSAMSPMISDTIRAAITPDYYVTITTVVVTNIDFTDQFEKAVEDKMIAEQNKLKADYENEQAIARAEAEARAAREKAQIEIEVAEAKARIKLIEAEADKNAQAEAAEAEAIKLKYNAIEMAKALGLTVAETKDPDTGLITSYEITYGADDADKAKLMTQYLEYIVYLETWDGKLPETLVSDSSATIMVPTQNP